jgi:hypothetical protein
MKYIKSYLSYVTDYLKLQNFIRLPGRKQTVGVTAKDNRLFVEAVYRYTKDLVIFESFIPALVDGQGVAYGKKYLRH